MQAVKNLRESSRVLLIAGDQIGQVKRLKSTHVVKAVDIALIGHPVDFLIEFDPGPGIACVEQFLSRHSIGVSYAPLQFAVEDPV